MPTDYAAIMLEIQKKLIDFYTNNSFPDGNNKSTQFEIAVFEASKEVFATYDRNNGLPQDYHTVEYLGGNIFPDIIIHIGATGQKVGMEVINIILQAMIGKQKETALMVQLKSMVCVKSILYLENLSTIPAI